MKNWFIVSGLNSSTVILNLAMETAQQSQIVTITPKAAEKVVEFMKQEGKDNLLLRVYVSGGGSLWFVLWYGF